MARGTKYEYREFYALVPNKLDYDVDRIHEVIKEEAPLSFRDSRSPSTWIICYSEEDRAYAVNYIARDQKGNRPGGLPIVEVGDSEIKVAAAYSDASNSRFGSLLKRINDEFPSKVYDEYGEVFEADFGRFPEMKIT